MDGYYSPKFANTAATGALSPTSLSGVSSILPKIELPEVGAKMLFVIHPYGGMNVVENNLVGGLDVIEVEVTAIKKSITTLE